MLKAALCFAMYTQADNKNIDNAIVLLKFTQS